MVTGLSVGVHYYVCAPHASGGIKGRIFVSSSTGIQQYVSFENSFRMYPNPTMGKLNLEYLSASALNGNVSNEAKEIIVDILTLSGQELIKIRNVELLTTQTFDLSLLPVGNYIVRISDDRKSFSKLLIKE